jgi:hypothetical protein
MRASSFLRFLFIWQLDTFHIAFPRALRWYPHIGARHIPYLDQPR